MKKVYSSSSSGVGFFGLLTVLFVGLKLTGHIDWSWWWILAPAWGPAAVVAAAVISAIFVMFINEVVKSKKRKTS